MAMNNHGEKREAAAAETYHKSPGGVPKQTAVAAVLTEYAYSHERKQSHNDAYSPNPFVLGKMMVLPMMANHQKSDSQL